MLRRDPHDPHDSHLRQLLDQRSARSAMAMDYDSPSVYSSPFFSPRPNEFDSRSLNSYRPPQSPDVHRNRLNELAESMLDLDDDSRAGGSDDDDEDDDDAPETIDAQHDGPEDPRLSLLGPKMRFHGKAPWEMDSDTLEEDDEPESDRGRDGIRKGLGFRSSSRGTTASGRPSAESGRSAKPKRSFETTSSASSPYGRGGALHALGQASLSSTSLVPQPPPPRQTGLRLNFPLGAARSDSPSPYATPPRAPASPRSIASRSNAPSPVPRSNHEYAQFPKNSNQPLTRRATNDSATSQSVYSEEMHPYANPDLVVSSADDPSTPAPARSAFEPPGVSRSDSTATVTESFTTGTSLSRSVTGSTLTPDTSASSLSPSQSPRNRVSMFHGKEISAPLPISGANNNISSPLMAPALPPGWAERSASPTFALISLEQARAQRSRSATAHNLSISSTSSTPFPEAPPPADGLDHSPANSIASRARARSISTGARAKTALQSIVGNVPPKPERRDSEPGTVPISGAPNKTLKHKKSGFMRLFNGARGAEKDDKLSPPPVPSLSDGYAAFNAQQQQQQQSGAKQGKVHRVPAPQVSPSIMEGPNMWDGSNRVSPTSRHAPPSLSIHTGPQSRLRAASAADDFQTRTVPSDMSERDWLGSDLPQSAPPNVTEFPALKLRPVSTLFSAHFSDHIVSPERQSGNDADADTVSSVSPTTVVSPITPGALGRNSGDRDKTPMATISEDQSALVQALQEQIGTAKKAWQRHIWELEGQVRDLKAEVDDLRAADGDSYCEACGRGRPAGTVQARGGTSAIHDHKTGVVNRPRARTGTSSRFGSAV
ncbi:hypothetical protein B0H11DRAFT_2191997 [Mycena galericulata]|nr:hypothetical protein B0H11DRAFT_2191997 [Mycena galericulata]